MKINAYWKRLTKRQKFFHILGALGVLTIAISIATRFAFLLDRADAAVSIAVVGPMSGPQAVVGQSIREGVTLLVEHVNEGGGIGRGKVNLQVFDDKGDPAQARAAAEEIVKRGNIALVVGHWSDATVRAAADVYRKARLPLLAPAALDPATLKEADWVFSTVFNDVQQSRFLANYARNVLGHRLVSIVRNEAVYGETQAKPFEETYRRFGTAIRYSWSFDPRKAVDGQMRAIVDDLKGKRDAGVLFLAMSEVEAARLIVMMRDSGVLNPVIGPVALATRGFTEEVRRLSEESAKIQGTRARPKEVAQYADGILMTAPLIFDTANEAAQNFRNSYLARFKTGPDWVAAYAYDSAKIALAVLKDVVGKEAVGGDAERRALRNDLASKMSPATAMPGVTGAIYFDRNGEAQNPVLIGIYNGRNVISALTQLQPIRSTSNANYIEELKRGRVLYVNDRFMYKTNVVYTGVQVNQIADINIEKNTALIDFTIWFRFQGDFRPEDVEFTNAAETVVLDEPADEMKVADMTYRLYRARGLFNLNFTKTPRSYGSQLVGLAFSHRALSRNNLLYVVDVLGLGLESGQTALEKLKSAKALHEKSGWEPERAWISQDVVEKSTLGSPNYVGFGAVEPEFSKIDYGAILKKDQVAVRDLIPSEYFIYLGIFGFLGTAFAVLMDRKERGRFWGVQSWSMRVVAWPVLLLAAGNLILDVAFQNLPTSYIDLMVVVYDTLWWLIPARLLGVAAERFIWQPLEDHTERNIPNVVRVFASVAIYSFAACGIIAFVFDQKITSLLATSGLLVMIVGLAVQANIANIFSGIVLNMERPFTVGDWVRIGSLDEGRVIDITWRTTRVKTRNGYVISVPNSKVSEAEIHNYDSFDVVRIELEFTLDASVPVDIAAPVMEKALFGTPNVLETPEGEIRFKGVRNNYGVWVADYELQFWIDNYGRREEISEKVLANVWAALRAHNIVPSEPTGPARLERPLGPTPALGLSEAAS